MKKRNSSSPKKTKTSKNKKEEIIDLSQDFAGEEFAFEFEDDDPPVVFEFDENLDED